ncbi:MAG: glutaredoxin, partial [Pseudomonadota bacterium]|nr:glutaredoxin [Pseudomonadota bacterium]
KRSVPQIYINDQHIPGGCDGLYKMDAEGTLDGMLKALS